MVKWSNTSMDQWFNASKKDIFRFCNIMDEDDGDENDGLYTVPGSEISDESSVTTRGGDTKGNE